ncbi:phage tail tube protein [Singulisphaera rosea]
MREILKLWTESTWGSFAWSSGSPVKNSDYIVVELNQSNAFTMRPKTIQKMIRTANAGNRVNKVYSSQVDLTGNLQTFLYPEQTSFLVGLGTTLSGSRPDLGSVTADHYIQMDSGTIAYRRYLGCKVTQLQLTSSADDTPVKAQLQLVAKSPATIGGGDFPVPAQSEFPQGNPYLFTDTAGGLTLGSSRTNFSSWDLSIKNIIDASRFENQYIGIAKWCGRDITWTNKLLYGSTTDRTNYEATTATTCSMELNNTVNTCTFTLENANYLTDVDDDLSMDKNFAQTLSWVNVFDESVPGDFSFATT